MAIANSANIYYLNVRSLLISLYCFLTCLQKVVAVRNQRRVSPANRILSNYTP